MNLNIKSRKCVQALNTTFSETPCPMLTKILKYLPVVLQEQHPLLSTAGAAILVLRITYLLS